MKRIFILICLCIIGIIASAQSTPTRQLPPLRTTDPAPSKTTTRAVIPIRTGGGNGSGGKIAPAALPTRKGGSGGTTTSPTNSAKAQQDKAAQLRTAAQKNGKTSQQPSSQPVKQATVPVPATPQVH